jgi:hypothetical protein
MPKTDPLLTLWQSLSLSEKADFKSILDKKSNKDNLLYLFNHIHQDFETIRVALGKPFYNVRERFLEYLVEFTFQIYAKQEPFEANLHCQLQKSKMFVRREMYAMANETLDQVIKEANDYDFHYITLDALNIKRLIYRKIYHGKEPQKLADNIEQVEKKLAEIKDQNHIANLHDQFANNASISLDETLLHNLNPLTQTITTQRLLHSLWAQLAEKRKDRENQKMHRLNVVNLLEAKPHWKTIYSGTYLTALANYASTLSPQNDTQEYERIISTIRNFKPASEFIGAESFQLATYLQTYFYLNLGKFDLACSLESAAEEKLNQFSGKLNLPYELTIYLNFALANWIKGNGEGALKWTNKILKIKNCPVRLDIQRFAYILASIIYSDLGKVSSLDKMLILANKPERCPIELEEFQKMLIRIIVKYHEAFENKKTLQLHELQSELAKPEYAKQLGRDEINFWIQHKLTGKPLLELVE